MDNWGHVGVISMSNVLWEVESGGGEEAGTPGSVTLWYCQLLNKIEMKHYQIQGLQEPPVEVHGSWKINI